MADLYDDYNSVQSQSREDQNKDTIVAEQRGCFSSFLKEIRELRWRVLAVACFLTFGSYFIYDVPGSIGMGKAHTIQRLFADHGKVYTNEMNQMLYSVYSWPNTVLSIFGGLLIDKFLGLRKAMLLFTMLILIGSGLFYIGINTAAYPLMLTARVVFGLGGESLAVAQSAFVARWFKGKPGMALAFGITISFSRVGSSFNFLFSPRIAEAYGVQVAALCGVGACGISVLACTILVLADIYAVRSGYIKAEAHEGDDGEVMKLSDIFRLPAEFWVISGICVCCYNAIFPFISVGKNFFEVKYGYSPSLAATYISLYQFTSACGSPVVSALVDAVGRNTFWLILASAAFMGVHALMIVTYIPGAVMVCAMGIFYSCLVAGLWPSVPYAVQDNMVGFAYGVMTAVQNVGLASFPIVVGKVLDHFTPEESADSSASSFDSASGDREGPLPTLKGYYITLLILIGAAMVSLLFSILLLFIDLRKGGILSASNSQRMRMLQERENLRQAEVSEDASLLPN